MGPIEVKYVDLGMQARQIEERLVSAVREIVCRGDCIGGEAVARFESRVGAVCEVRHAVAVANGTDAIRLVLEALGIGPGDEVLTVPNSFVATAGAIATAGARPVFIDVRDDFNIDPERIEAAVTPRTRAILPVHLTGRPADMTPIQEIARSRSLAVIEDAAQAIGATYDGKPVGGLGTAGCFSLHPLKNLAACGDGGLITTDDDELAARLRKMRNHGLGNRDESDFFAHNSRLDSIQAAILLVRLDHLESWTESRRANAAFYRERLADVVDVPVESPRERAVYHTFVIQAKRRDELRDFLTARGIETKIHYPIPIHRMAAAAHLGYGPGSFPKAERQATRILSLPIYPELTDAQKEHVVLSIRAFYRGDRP